MSVKQTKRKETKSNKTTVMTPVSYENICPIWVFDKIDRNGKYAFDINRTDFKHYEILDKIISYATMTWGELSRQTHDNGKSKNHYIDADKISKEAQERLKKMDLEEESDLLYSIALKNKLRVVGLRDKDRFHVLWYDPEHEVYPSAKKHT